MLSCFKVETCIDLLLLNSSVFRWTAWKISFPKNQFAEITKMNSIHSAKLFWNLFMLLGISIGWSFFPFSINVFYFCFYSFNLFKKLWLIYSVVYVSGIQKSDSDYISIYLSILFFRFFSLIDYYTILSIVSCAEC